MIRRQHLLLVCSSEISLQFKWTCKQNLVKQWKKNASREFNLSNWVRLIYLRNLKMHLLRLMLLFRRVLLLNNPNRMLSLIWRLRLFKLKLQLQSLLIMLWLKLMPHLQQIWHKCKLIWRLQKQRLSRTRIWRRTTDSRLMINFSNISRSSLSTPLTQRISSLVFQAHE